MAEDLVAALHTPTFRPALTASSNSLLMPGRAGTFPDPAQHAQAHDEILVYHQDAGKVRAKVLQNLKVRTSSGGSQATSLCKLYAAWAVAKLSDNVLQAPLRGLCQQCIAWASHADVRFDQEAFVVHSDNLLGPCPTQLQWTCCCIMLLEPAEHADYIKSDVYWPAVCSSVLMAPFRLTESAASVGLFVHRFGPRDLLSSASSRSVFTQQVYA